VGAHWCLGKRYCHLGVAVAINDAAVGKGGLGQDCKARGRWGLGEGKELVEGGLKGEGSKAKRGW